MKHLIFLVGVALVLASCSQAPNAIEATGFGVESGEKGNGAETWIDVNNSAWFTNSTLWPRACYQVDPGFGVSRETIAKAVNEAEHAWWNYVHSKQIEVSIRMLNSWNIVECYGDEDIVYYFGSKPQEVQDALSKFTRPVAFAYRTEVDVAAGKSRGFIWVAPQGALTTGSAVYPDWSQRYNLTGILMHELGHVYGVDHVSLTIMDERVADFLSMNDSERKERLSGIDSYRDLYICLDCPVSKPGLLGLAVDQNFKELVGRTSVGPVFARVEGSFTKSLKLIIDDFSGTSVFDVEIPSLEDGLSSSGETEGIFRVASADQDGLITFTQINRGTRVVYAKMKTSLGRELPLVIELNMSTKTKLGGDDVIVDGLVIKTFEQGLPKVLFYSVAYQL